MTEETTNPVDGEAMPEVVDAPESESEAEILDQEAEEEEDLEEAEFEGKQYKLPKELKDALLRQADYTKKTQEVAEQRKAVEAQQKAIAEASQRQIEFAQDIAKLGALNARLEPYNAVRDWGAHIRQHGAAGQADYADYMAAKAERDDFAQGLTTKVQQRQSDEQREAAKQIAEARAEIAKHIPGYGEETLSKLVTLGAQYGYSSDEIRQAEADQRSIRVLHRLAELEAAASKQSTQQKLTQQQSIRPAVKVSGAAHSTKRPDQMSTDEWMKWRERQRKAL